MSDISPSSSLLSVDFFEDCKTFAKTVQEKTGNKPFTGKIDRQFIKRMVMDELNELDDAKDETEEVDALLDAVYYIFDHLAKTGLDIRPIWKLIHQANMRKFGPGGFMENGKWHKPSSFVPPDEDIRKEIEKQRKQLLQ